jgi:hypothetical protein
MEVNHNGTTASTEHRGYGNIVFRAFVAGGFIQLYGGLAFWFCDVYTDRIAGNLSRLVIERFLGAFLK